MIRVETFNDLQRFQHRLNTIKPDRVIERFAGADQSGWWAILVYWSDDEA